MSILLFAVFVTKWAKSAPIYAKVDENQRVVVMKECGIYIFNYDKRKGLKNGI